MYCLITIYIYIYIYISLYEWMRMFKALLLSLCERRNTCLSMTFWEQICAVVSFFLFSFAVLHLRQITEHGSNSSFEPFACSKKASGRYCGLSKGPRRGVPKSVSITSRRDEQRKNQGAGERTQFSPQQPGEWTPARAAGKEMRGEWSHFD